MKRYELASVSARQDVDLRDYAEIIQGAVHNVIPKAWVKVEQDCYFVSPTPTQGEAIKIGRQICQSQLKVHCVQIPKLFTSIELEEEEHGTTRKKPVGGHH